MKKNENIVISIQKGQKGRFWRFINRKAMKSMRKCANMLMS